MKNVFFILLLTLLFSCRSYKSAFGNDDKLELSEGGGFTGAVKSWQLQGSGQVFLKKETDTSFQLVGAVSRNVVSKYFSEANDFFKAEVPTHPLNYSRSIKLINKTKTVSTIWSPGNDNFKKYDSFYSELISIFEKVNP